MGILGKNNNNTAVCRSTSRGWEGVERSKKGGVHKRLSHITLRGGKRAPLLLTQLAGSPSRDGARFLSGSSLLAQPFPPCACAPSHFLATFLPCQPSCRHDLWSTAKRTSFSLNISEDCFHLVFFHCERILVQLCFSLAFKATIFFRYSISTWSVFPHFAPFQDFQASRTE
jgi:hypothetical protein